MSADVGTFLEPWHDFFTAVAGLSGTLLGLLFVAVTLNPTFMSDDGPAGMRVWSGVTFHNFLVLVILGIAGLVPSDAGTTFVITLLIIGVQGIIRVVTDMRRVRADPDPDWGGRHALIRFVSPAVAYVACLITAYGVWIGDPSYLSWLVAVVFCLTISAAASCWDLLQSVARMQKERATDSPADE
jgi:hypothetical protein